MYIRDLVLHTRNLEKQYQLYVNELAFPLIEKWQAAFCIRAGITHLTFQKSEVPNEPYHFAFGLKKERVSVALDFLEQRVEVIHTNENPGKIVDFPSWNAKSVYFYDADGNVVECISRNCDLTAQGEVFSISDVKSICEIGLPVDNVKETYLALKKAFNLGKCPGELNNFCPAGDEHGMVILVAIREKLWFPTSIPVQSVDFKAFIQNECHIGEIVSQNGKLAVF
ncbi:MAG: hypothetical protein ACEPOZ_16120 [Marinifilaceae bacterium]